MKYFKFKISKCFYLTGDHIAMAGDMIPKDFPFITKDYFMKLVLNNKTLHAFKIMGEDRFSRTERNNQNRALRTLDDIKDLLLSIDLNNGANSLYVIGSLDKEILNDNFKID